MTRPAIWSMNTFTLRKLPPGRKLVGTKWVYKVKHKKDGSVERFKARLVAQGFTQIPGVDFEVAFAPAARFVTIRHILSLGNGFGWPIEQADVDTAFLYAELDYKIYVKQPEGHEDQEHPG